MYEINFYCGGEIQDDDGVALEAVTKSSLKLCRQVLAEVYGGVTMLPTTGSWFGPKPQEIFYDEPGFLFQVIDEENDHAETHNNAVGRAEELKMILRQKSVMFTIKPLTNIKFV